MREVDFRRLFAHDATVHPVVPPVPREDDVQRASDVSRRPSRPPWVRARAGLRAAEPPGIGRDARSDRPAARGDRAAVAGGSQVVERAAGDVSAARRRPASAADPEARAVAIARGQAPLRRALASLAGRFVATHGWERLGFARLADYARERLGLGARQLQDLAHVDAALARLPAIEAAFIAGALSWTKTRLLCRVATPVDEARWLAFARRTPARALAREVRAVDLGSLEAGPARGERSVLSPGSLRVAREPGAARGADTGALQGEASVPSPGSAAIASEPGAAGGAGDAEDRVTSAPDSRADAPVAIPCAAADFAATDEDGAPEEPQETVVLACTPAVRAKWWHTQQIARRVAGERLPPWACMEAVVAEVLAILPTEAADAAAIAEPTAPAPADACTGDADEGTDGATARAYGASADAVARAPASACAGGAAEGAEGEAARVEGASAGPVARAPASACAGDAGAGGAATERVGVGIMYANAFAYALDRRDPAMPAVPPSASAPAGASSARDHAGESMSGASTSATTPANAFAFALSRSSASTPLRPEVAELLAGLAGADAFELDARLRRAVALEQRAWPRLAPALAAVAGRRLHRARGHRTLEDWARERLGISPRKARALLRLERAAASCPPLRAAFHEGQLSWVQAHALVSVLAAGPAAPWCSDWIEHARRVSVRRLLDDVDRALTLAEVDPAAFAASGGLTGAAPEASNEADSPTPHAAEMRQTGAQPSVAGREVVAEDASADAGSTQRRDRDASPPETARFFFTAPADVARLVRATICSVRRRLERVFGRPGSAGEAVDAMLDHALATWGDDAPIAARHRVFARDGWRCTVPGCSSYRNLHDHHVVFRSHGGGDDAANRTTLCAFHHLRGVHAGLVRIAGSAPAGLRFELGLRPGRAPLAAWGSGDVRISPRAAARTSR